MILTLFIILSSFFCLQSQKAFENFVASEKCPLTKVETHIFEMRYLNQSQITLPRLKDLKPLYPGDKFFVSQEKLCEDESPLCAKAVSRGACIGLDSKWSESMFTDKFNKDHQEKYGFNTFTGNTTNALQVLVMQSSCRVSCRKWLEDHPEVELPTVLKGHDDFQDMVTDSFGITSTVCALGDGQTVPARRAKFNQIPNFLGQRKVVPRITDIGFEKVNIPKDIYGLILTNRKKLLKNGQKWKIEYCSQGLQNCNKVVESQNAQECHEVSSEKYWFLDLEKTTKSYIFNLLKKLAEEWIGHKFHLEGTTAYGLRKYTRGATLAAHLDHLKTHVISAILNINQKVDSDWPLQIFDHDGVLHNVFLKPGEMVWYESAKLVHGRSAPFNGTYFENIFVHFMPASQQWYQHDFSVTFTDPVKPITVQDLIDEQQLT